MKAQADIFLLYVTQKSQKYWVASLKNFQKSILKPFENHF